MNLINDSHVRISEFTITGFDHLTNQKLLGAVILITYFLILLGSATNLCIILNDRRLHTPMYILICNLAIVDIMFTTSASTTMISVLLADIKTISYYSCISRMYIYHLGDVTECLALSLMAMDRMIAISLPLKYHSILTNPRVLGLIVFTWIVGIGAIAPLALTADNLPYCQPIIRYVFCDYAAIVRAACADPEPSFLVGVIIGIWLTFGQLSFILLTYLRIIYSVVTMSNKDNQGQLFKTCLTHFIAVFLYYVPKFVSVLLTRVGVKLNLTERNAILIVATLISPLVNPTIYCLRTKEIRKRLFVLFSKLQVSPAH